MAGSDSLPAPLNLQGTNYQLKEMLGRGQFGVVWRAEAPGGVEVAVKIIERTLKPEEAARELQALQFVRKLRHPYLLSLQAFFSLDERLIIILELADKSLRVLFEEHQAAGNKGLSAQELIGYFREAAEALDYLHANNLQHRDIKPDNLLLLGRHIKVADCGLARMVEEQTLQAASTVGTPAYMAPEVWNQEVHRHSDQYSLAVTYAELRAGKFPFSRASLARLIHAHMAEDPDLATLEPAEQEVLRQAMAKDPRQRFESCTEFIQALVNVLAWKETPVRAVPLGVGAKGSAQKTDVPPPDRSTKDAPKGAFATAVSVETLARHPETSPLPVTITEPPSREWRSSAKKTNRWKLLVPLAVLVIGGLSVAAGLNGLLPWQKPVEEPGPGLIAKVTPENIPPVETPSLPKEPEEKKPEPIVKQDPESKPEVKLPPKEPPVVKQDPESKPEVKLPPKEPPVVKQDPERKPEVKPPPKDPEEKVPGPIAKLDPERKSDVKLPPKEPDENVLGPMAKLDPTHKPEASSKPNPNAPTPPKQDPEEKGPTVAKQDPERKPEVKIKATPIEPVSPIPPEEKGTGPLAKLDPERKPELKGPPPGELNYHEGLKFYLGKGKRFDRKEAMRLFALAAAKGHALAQSFLGLLTFEGISGGAKNEQEGTEWVVKSWEKLRQEAEKGDPAAQCNLGRTYLLGLGVGKDEVKAFLWFNKSAEQDYPSAISNVGNAFAKGEGTEKDEVRAIEWYRKAAEQQYPPAQNSLGLAYETGRGVAKDEKEAAKWFREAAERGYPTAQNNLGLMYMKGYGVEKDEVVAAHWFRKAANQGYPRAQNTLGVMYGKGNGVEKDDVEAVKWYRKAAEQDYALGQANLAAMYAGGRGVTKDEVEAVKWYRKSAENGHPNGQYHLGRCYEKGVGIGVNMEEAVRWYRRAADQGNELAQLALKRLKVTK